MIVETQNVVLGGFNSAKVVVRLNVLLLHLHPVLSMVSPATTDVRYQLPRRC